jgi:hypothetical protein
VELASDAGFCDYETVGLMNINSISGGLVSAVKPARFDDGMVDLFRQRNFFGNLQRGNKWNTEKYMDAVFRIPSTLPGMFCQYDGEARFLFSPDGDSYELRISRCMRIPAVIGPNAGQDAEPEEQEDRLSPYHWDEALHWAVEMENAPWLPARTPKELDNCKEQCLYYNWGGFCVRNGKAEFWVGSGCSLKSALKDYTGIEGDTMDLCTYVYNAAFEFDFIGAGKQAQSFRKRFEDWVRGELVAEMNADDEEVTQCEKTSKLFAQGKCSRSQRVWMSFGGTLKGCACALCGASTKHAGCRGCRRIFCYKCFSEDGGHRNGAYNFKWMYDDAGLNILKPLARMDPLRWSEMLSLKQTIEAMDQVVRSKDNHSRSIKMNAYKTDDVCAREYTFTTPDGALQELLKVKDQENLEDEKEKEKREKEEQAVGCADCASCPYTLDQKVEYWSEGRRLWNPATVSAIGEDNSVTVVSMESRCKTPRCKIILAQDLRRLLRPRQATDESSFEIVLSKVKGSHIGIISSESYRIVEIRDGLVKLWNDEHSEMKVLCDDRIIEVNGIIPEEKGSKKEDFDKMRAECQKEEVELRMTIVRVKVALQ